MFEVIFGFSSVDQKNGRLGFATESRARRAMLRAAARRPGLLVALLHNGQPVETFEATGHVCESTLTADGCGAYCGTCGATLE